MSGADKIAHLLAEIDDGIGCRHRFEPAYGVSFDLLKRLGLLSPINSRIPPCSQHGCPLIGNCPYQADFEEQKNVRGGRKFRLTPEGRALILDPALIERLVADEPLAASLLATLDDSPCTIFELAARLLDQQIAEVEGVGVGAAPDGPTCSRRELGGLLRLLQGLGMIAFEPDGITVRRLARVPHP